MQSPLRISVVRVLGFVVPRCLVWVIAKLTHFLDIQIELTDAMEQRFEGSCRQ